MTWFGKWMGAFPKAPKFPEVPCEPTSESTEQTPDDTAIDIVSPDPNPDQEAIFFAEQDPEDKKTKALLNSSLEQDIGHRKEYADKAHALVQTWVGFLIVLISAQFGLKSLGYGLSEAEFSVVVISLTSLVFGFWLLVGRYLFPGKGSRS